MVFCNEFILSEQRWERSHNPYFNRWFSAIKTWCVKTQVETVTILILIDGFLQWNIPYRYFNGKNCHNPYFNRWFSAIEREAYYERLNNSHNPYFNRWFSAIATYYNMYITVETVTILILIDGFLQYENIPIFVEVNGKSQSLF